jgi:hypothetical protein
MYLHAGDAPDVPDQQLFSLEQFTFNVSSTPCEMFAFMCDYRT